MIRQVVPAPDFQSGEAGFQTRENALSFNYRALALVKTEIYEIRAEGTA